MAGVTGRSIDEIVDEYRDSGYGVFKAAVAEAVVEELKPFRAAYDSIRNDDVRAVLRESGIKGRDMAEVTMRDVRKATGIKRF